MCDYQGYEFGAGTYPDSVCIEGRLYDADNCDSNGNLYEPMEWKDCPICKPKEAIQGYIDSWSGGEEDQSLIESNAVSLVNDIRSNRGYQPYLKEATNEQS